MSQQPALAHKPIKRGAEAHSSEGIVPPALSPHHRAQ